ncbi:tail fiber assembly protein [Achromobacter sp. NPDC058515]|uniref:tail fiber assembly protein n=1 Tax=Achromobacter sp. NPDC058515 TaxID=3346533 RepID=UPI0036673917
MRTYARVSEGLVVELFSTDQEMAELFHPALVWVDVSDLAPKPAEGWSYEGARFLSPPPLGEEAVAAQVDATKSALMSMAASAIAPLQDAVDLGIATEEEAELLRQWKTYRVLLNRAAEQEGYPGEVKWPVSPS